MRKSPGSKVLRWLPENGTPNPPHHLEDELCVCVEVTPCWPTVFAVVHPEVGSCSLTSNYSTFCIQHSIFPQAQQPSAANGRSYQRLADAAELGYSKHGHASIELDCVVSISSAK